MILSTFLLAMAFSYVNTPLCALLGIMAVVKDVLSNNEKGHHVAKILGNMPAS